MLFNVPQYVDVEDKVAGPLTAKQLGWMMLMFGILTVMWLSIPNKAIVIMAGIPVVGIFVALAFVKPYGQTMISLVVAGVRFFVLPKIYVWKRSVEHSLTPNVGAKKKSAEPERQFRSQEEKKKKTLENLGKIAKIVDSKGSDES